MKISFLTLKRQGKIIKTIIIIIIGKQRKLHFIFCFLFRRTIENWLAVFFIYLCIYLCIDLSISFLLNIYDPRLYTHMPPVKFWLPFVTMFVLCTLSTKISFVYFTRNLRRRFYRAFWSTSITVVSRKVVHSRHDTIARRVNARKRQQTFSSLILDF